MCSILHRSLSGLMPLTGWYLWALDTAVKASHRRQAFHRPISNLSQVLYLSQIPNLSQVLCLSQAQCAASHRHNGHSPVMSPCTIQMVLLHSPLVDDWTELSGRGLCMMVCLFQTRMYVPLLGWKCRRPKECLTSLQTKAWVDARLA